jgi:hypothetical protein
MRRSNGRDVSSRLVVGRRLGFETGFALLAAYGRTLTPRQLGVEMAEKDTC